MFSVIRASYQASVRIFLVRQGSKSAMPNREEILYLFDVDGTLTQPRKCIEDDMRDFLLKEVKPRCTLGVIGGSDLPKIQEQLGSYDVVKTFDYVFSENGLVAYKNGELIANESIQKHLGEEKLQAFINGALRELSEIQIPIKRGTFIEFRSGMLNVSPIGRSCSQSERDAFEVYDKEHKVRQKLINRLKERFLDFGLVYSIGGQISFDVVPEGWDKRFSLNHIDKKVIKDIHFFGDRTEPGGNDYELYCDSRVTGHKVNSPKDTKQQLIKLLNLESICETTLSG